QPAAGGQFAAEVLQVGRGQPAFEEGAGVDAGGGVPLEVDLVAAAGGLGPAEEVVEAHFKQGGGRGVGGDVPAGAGLVLVGPHDDGHGVPAGQAFDAPLDLAAAGEGWLPVAADGVDVGRVGGEGDLDPAADRLVLELGEQEAGAFRAAGLQHRLEG